MFGLTIGDAVGAHVKFKTYSYLQKNPVTDLQGGGTWRLEKGQVKKYRNVAARDCITIKFSPLF
jgi:hypothetical protein